MIIDFLIIFIIIISIILGYRKGICSMLISFGAFALSAIIVLTMYGTFSDFISETEFGKNIQISISDGVEEYIQGISEKTFDKLPFVNVSKLFEESNGNLTSATEKLTEKVIEGITSLILFILAFFASKLLFFLIKKLVNVAASLPIIRNVDSILGLFGGLLFGIIWTVVIYIASGYLSLLGNIPFLEEQFNSSILILLISDVFM